MYFLRLRKLLTYIPTETKYNTEYLSACQECLTSAMPTCFYAFVTQKSAISHCGVRTAKKKASHLPFPDKSENFSNIWSEKQDMTMRGPKLTSSVQQPITSLTI